MTVPTEIDALKLAIVVLKSQAAVARAVGRTSQAISDLLSRATRVPAEWCISLETATEAAGQKISRAQFRPDLWPEEHARLVKAAARTAQREQPVRNHAQPHSKPASGAPAPSRGLRALMGGG